MKKLELENFKGFSRPIEINPDSKSLLIHGENGSGKSSIAEAMRLVFYHDKLYRRFARKGARPEDERQRFVESYAFCNAADRTFSLKINGVSYDRQSYKKKHCAIVTSSVFALERNASQDAVSPYRPDTINFRQIMEAVDYAYWDDTDDTKDMEHLQAVVADVNRLLKERFFETFYIGIEDDEMYVFIENEKTGLRASEDLHQHFNEAKIHLTTLLLVLVTVKKEYWQHRMKGSHDILVLDDVVTSLDSCNRTFIIEYLLDEFSRWQLMVLTHNTSFNNTFVKYIEERGLQDKWQCLSLYVRNDGPRVYDVRAFRKASDLKKELDSNPTDNTSLTTEVRKYFEALLIEFAKLTLLDARERANFYLKQLQNDKKSIFLRMDGSGVKHADDLVESILSTLQSDTSPDSKLQSIKDQIANYTQGTDTQSVLPLISRLHLYEKLFVHGSAHGGKAIAAVTNKELCAVIHLVGELEQSVNRLKGEIGDM